jgi:hypothetical protein
MLSESFIFVPGTEVELTLGIKDSMVKIPTSSKRDHMKNSKQTTLLV